MPWAGVILDEAQNIKNPETRQARGGAGACRQVTASLSPARRWKTTWATCGRSWSSLTPASWAPGSVQAQFFIPIQAQSGPRGGERLKRLTGPFILRRLKTDRQIIADLPEKKEMKVFCNLTKEQASLYAAVVKEMEEALEAAEGIQRKGMILGDLSKLKQVCNHPAQFLADNSAIPGRSGKLARLTEMLEEILEIGDRALVFSQFCRDGRNYSSGTCTRRSGGKSSSCTAGSPRSSGTRWSSASRPTADGRRMFILSLKAGGTGLNLTGANHVFHFDRWWNPGGREPGHRPRLPHRPDQERPGAQVPVRWARLRRRSTR